MVKVFRRRSDQRTSHVALAIGTEQCRIACAA